MNFFNLLKFYIYNRASIVVDFYISWNLDDKILPRINYLNKYYIYNEL